MKAHVEPDRARRSAAASRLQVVGDAGTRLAAMLTPASCGSPSAVPSAPMPADRLALAALGHDLREPLRKVIRELERLRAEPAAGTGEDACRSVETALRTARRMQAQLRGILAIAASEQGPRRWAPVALDEVLAEVLDDLALPIAESGARVSLGRLPVVPGERALLHVAAQNLVQNAVRYARPGEPPRIVVRAVADARGRRGFAVLDRGIGFAAAPQDRRAVPGARDGVERWGLGLQLARAVAARHEGVLEIGPRRAGGTRAALLVPGPPG